MKLYTHNIKRQSLSVVEREVFACLPQQCEFRSGEISITLEWTLTRTGMLLGALESKGYLVKFRRYTPLTGLQGFVYLIKNGNSIKKANYENDKWYKERTQSKRRAIKLKERELDVIR